MPQNPETAQTPETAFTANRPLLVGVAYRLLGSVGDAEDVVQEAWLRWARVDTETVADPTAFLVRTVEPAGPRPAAPRRRPARDLRRPVAARAVLTGGAADPADEAERAASVSLAMLVVLETLSPLERTVFVLHEAFAYSYGEIGEIARPQPGGRAPARAPRPRARGGPPAAVPGRPGGAPGGHRAVPARDRSPATSPR